MVKRLLSGKRPCLKVTDSGTGIRALVRAAPCVGRAVWPPAVAASASSNKNAIDFLRFMKTLWIATGGSWRLQKTYVQYPSIYPSINASVLASVLVNPSAEK